MAAEEVDWKTEYKKCINSPYYFYTHYCIINGEQATTTLSEEEFNNLIQK
jgi:hypothetical protein